ncbi:type II/IV secretion system protein [Betaproteobacteria bacterium PRO7]|nr:type II/IV secretion system protein [Betaproteobacteria bacterium PRO7]
MTERASLQTPRTPLHSAAQSLGVAYFDDQALAACAPRFEHVTREEAGRRRVAPVADADGSTIYVIAEPTDTAVLDWLCARCEAPVRWGLAEPDAIAAFLAENEDGAVNDAMDALQSRPPARADGNAASASPVVGFVDRVIDGAWTAGASDIHFETRREGLGVKYRIDGVLVPAGRWTGTEPPEEILSRIKVLAQLDIAERRVPQDGRFSRVLGGRAVDFRVSVMPNAIGEDAVLRLLDKRHLLGAVGAMTLDGLGFKDESLRRIRRLARLPHGMMLVTGPTGSGKTTTVYAAISETLKGEEKVVTIEDPIEYELSGVLQIPVNEGKGLTFARGLRSILRHDPDTIFVGEIRDPETADIAVQSALTGHLVFTTVHANNVFDVIGRFLHMDVDLFSLMSALNGVVSQRLVRLLCAHCAQRDATSEAVLRERGLPLGSSDRLRLATGCERCRFTGYAGRTVVSETLLVDDRFRELVVGRAPVGEMRAHVKSLCPVSMQDEALALIESGQTSYQEIERVLAVG